MEPLLSEVGPLAGETIRLGMLQINDANEAWPETPILGSPAAAPQEPPATPRLELATTEPLKLFLDSVVTAPPPPIIAATPTRKQKTSMRGPAASPRRSGRLAIKKKARQFGDGVQAVQELVARICGVLGPAASFDEASKEAYEKIFLQAPLASTAIQALDALVKQVQHLKKMSPKKKTIAKAITVLPAANV
jgi:hypothetical protein